MNTGVEILLARMETNPDEFIGEYARWSEVIRAVDARKKGDHDFGDSLPFLSDEEIDRLYDKWCEISRKSFDDRVMRELLADKDDAGAPTSIFTLRPRPAVVTGRSTNANWTHVEMEKQRIAAQQARLTSLSQATGLYDAAQSAQAGALNNYGNMYANAIQADNRWLEDKLREHEANLKKSVGSKLGRALLGGK